MSYHLLLVLGDTGNLESLEKQNENSTLSL